MYTAQITTVIGRNILCIVHYRLDHGKKVPKKHMLHDAMCTLDPHSDIYGNDGLHRDKQRPDIFCTTSVRLNCVPKYKIHHIIPPYVTTQYLYINYRIFVGGTSTPNSPVGRRSQTLYVVLFATCTFASGVHYGALMDRRVRSLTRGKYCTR